MARNLLVGDNDRLPPPQQRQHRRSGGFDQPRTDENVITPFRERDAQALGRGLISLCHLSLSASGGRETSGQFASAAITRAVVCSAEPSLLSITISASA